VCASFALRLQKAAPGLIDRIKSRMAGRLLTSRLIKLFEVICLDLWAGLDKGCDIAAAVLGHIGCAVIPNLNTGCDVAIAILCQD